MKKPPPLPYQPPEPVKLPGVTPPVPDYQLQQYKQPEVDKSYRGNLPQQQPVVVKQGYTFDKFLLHTLAVVVIGAFLTFVGCVLLIGGCTVALDNEISKMSGGETNAFGVPIDTDWKEVMEGQGHSKEHIDSVATLTYDQRITIESAIQRLYGDSIEPWSEIDELILWKYLPETFKTTETGRYKSRSTITAVERGSDELFVITYNAEKLPHMDDMMMVQDVEVTWRDGQKLPKGKRPKNQDDKQLTKVVTTITERQQDIIEGGLESTNRPWDGDIPDYLKLKYVPETLKIRTLLVSTVAPTPGNLERWAVTGVDEKYGKFVVTFDWQRHGHLGGGLHKIYSIKRID